MDLEEYLEESSRTQPADEDLWQNWRVSTRISGEGEELANEIRNGKRKYEACFLSGNFVGELEKSLSSTGTSVMLSETFLKPPTEEVDKGSLLPEKRIMRTYMCEGTLLFVLHDLHICILQAVLESADELGLYLTGATMMYAFTYESIAEFRSPRGMDLRESTFFVPNSYCDASVYAGIRIQPLPMPNVLGKAGAVALTYCEKNKLPCVAVVHYLELTDVSANLLPFRDIINSSPALNKVFKKFPELFHFSKSENTILSSNLFV